MLKKVIGFNGSPRKGWNTYQLVQKALEGAKDAGAETKFYHLHDLNIHPCQSCLTCQKDDKHAGKCVLKDDLQPILEEIKQADAVIFGTPIYFSYPSATIHSLLERLWFSNLSYSPKRTVFPRKTKSAFIYTMNVDEQMAKQMNYPLMFNFNEKTTEGLLRDKCTTLCSYFTQQVKDYSKYNIKMFDPEAKYKQHREQFPIDLENAYKLGQALVLSE